MKNLALDKLIAEVNRLFVSQGEAARIRNCSKQWINDLVRAKRLTGYTLAGHPVVLRDEVETLKNRKPTNKSVSEPYSSHQPECVAEAAKPIDLLADCEAILNGNFNNSLVDEVRNQ